MLLENRFQLPLPADEAWSGLMDVERVAMCLPGASLDAMNGDQFDGRVKVKVGPISISFKGSAEFIRKDPDAREAVLEAVGKEIGGNGTAKATLTMRVHELDGGSDVELHTDLAITGKAAKFGRGVIADVAGRLVDQFAAGLTVELSGGSQPDDDVDVADGVGAGSRAATPGQAAEAPPFQLLAMPSGGLFARLSALPRGSALRAALLAAGLVVFGLLRRKRRAG